MQNKNISHSPFWTLVQSWGGSSDSRLPTYPFPWGSCLRLSCPVPTPKPFSRQRTPFLTCNLENRMRSIGPLAPAGSQRRLICGKRDDAGWWKRFMRERNIGQGPWFLFPSICFRITTELCGCKKLSKVIWYKFLHPEDLQAAKTKTWWPGARKLVLWKRYCLVFSWPRFI